MYSQRIQILKFDEFMLHLDAFFRSEMLQFDALLKIVYPDLGMSHIDELDEILWTASAPEDWRYGTRYSLRNSRLPLHVSMLGDLYSSLRYVDAQMTAFRRMDSARGVYASPPPLNQGVAIWPQTMGGVLFCPLVDFDQQTWHSFQECVKFWSHRSLKDALFESHWEGKKFSFTEIPEAPFPKDFGSYWISNP